jgi:hypothetical protein
MTPEAPTRAKAVMAAFVAATLYAVWLFNMILGEGGDKSFIGFLLVPLALVVILLAVPLIFAFRAAEALRTRAGARSMRSMWTLLIAALAALAVAVSGFRFLIPAYVQPPYEQSEARHDEARDFIAPWGGMMIAVSYGFPPHRESALAGRVLWVAETELTRAEHARLLGAPAGEQPSLPVTGLDAASIEDVVARANRAPGQRPTGGLFRLPTEYEAMTYSGDWWITNYPKSVYRCSDKLEGVADAGSNGLGLRGTTGNAAEIVTSRSPGASYSFCAMLGGVPPYCGSDSKSPKGNVKRVGIATCGEERVFGHPMVGLRLVYSVEELGAGRPTSSPTPRAGS